MTFHDTVKQNLKSSLYENYKVAITIDAFMLKTM